MPLLCPTTPHLTVLRLCRTGPHITQRRRTVPLLNITPSYHAIALRHDTRVRLTTPHHYRSLALLNWAIPQRYRTPHHSTQATRYQTLWYATLPTHDSAGQDATPQCRCHTSTHITKPLRIEIHGFTAASGFSVLEIFGTR